MKRLLIYTACLGALLTAGLQVTKAQAAVSFSLRIGDRYRGPALSFYSQPDVVLIPGTDVYYVDNADYDLYRYGDFWYYYYDGGWYRADDIDGPFYFISYTTVPYSIRYVPVSYRHHWRNYRGAMYGSYRNGYWYSNPSYYRTYQNYPSRTYYQNRTYDQNRGYNQYQRNRATYESQPQNRPYYPTRNYIQQRQQQQNSRDFNPVSRREAPQQQPRPQAPQPQQQPQHGRGQGHGNGHGNGNGNGRGHNHNDNGQ
jgi:hypothetical protein